MFLAPDRCYTLSTTNHARRLLHRPSMNNCVVRDEVKPRVSSLSFFGTWHDLSAGPISVYTGSAPFSATTNSCAHRPGDETRPKKPFQGEGMMFEGLQFAECAERSSGIVVQEEFACSVPFAGLETSM